GGGGGAATRSLSARIGTSAPGWSPADKGDAHACRVVVAPLTTSAPRPGSVAPARLFLNELASALIERPESLLRGDRCADLVVVPWVLRLRRLLDLNEIRGMDLAAVDANRPLAEERIVGRHLLHLGDDLGALVALERLHGLQVVQRPRVYARVDHRGMDLPVTLGEALGERARLVVHVPVKGLGEGQPLCLLETEGVHVSEEHQEAGEVLAALHDAELGTLLDRVGGVAAGIGQPDDLSLRGLRLEQKRREVLGVERMTDLAQHLAAVLEHDRLDVALEGVTERVV